MRVWMCTPDLTLPGGVVSSVKALLPHLPEVRVLEVGRRARGPGMVFDPLRVLKRRRASAVLHLNPSMRPRALARDLALLRCWKGMPAALWFHGWDKGFTQSMPVSLRQQLRIGCAHATPVCLTDEFAGLLADLGVDRQRIRVVPPPFVRTASLCKTRGDHVVFLGRLVGGKGLVPLLHGFSRIADRYPAVNLRILGQGSLRKPLVAAAKAMGLLHRVSLPGHVEGRAKDKVLSESAVLVLASRSEGVPVCMLEAMDRGLPVIAPDVGGVCTVLKPAGGVVLSSCSAAEIARALDRVLGDREAANAMGRFNRAQVSGHEAGVIAARWRVIYQEITA